MELLNEAAGHFSTRGFVDWEREARESGMKIQNDDFSAIESLWIKYSPTGDVDNLIITDYDPEDEDRVHALNDRLAEIINPLFWMLDKAMKKMT